MVVRVFQRNNDYGLEAVMLSGPGGYDAGRYNPGHVSLRVTKALSRDEWQTVIARLEAIQLWQMTTTGGNFGEDGAMWILEARRNGYRLAVSRKAFCQSRELKGWRALITLLLWALSRTVSERPQRLLSEVDRT